MVNHNENEDENEKKRVNDLQRNARVLCREMRLNMLISVFIQFEIFLILSSFLRSSVRNCWETSLDKRFVEFCSHAVIV